MRAAALSVGEIASMLSSSLSALTIDVSQRSISSAYAKGDSRDATAAKAGVRTAGEVAACGGCDDALVNRSNRMPRSRWAPGKQRTVGWR
jgi:hypothetical protein